MGCAFIRVCAIVILIGTLPGLIQDAAAADPTFPCALPGGGAVQVIAIAPTTPTTIYAGTALGVLKSADAGDTWCRVPDVRRFVSALVVDPNAPSTVYAASGAGGILRSTDGGATWQPIGATLGDAGVGAIVIDRSDPSRLYATVAGQGIVKSVDGGQSWVTINNGIPNVFDVDLLAIDRGNPANLYADVFGYGLLKSVDGGASWHPTGLSSDKVVYSQHVSAIAIDPAEPSTSYAAVTSEPPAASDGVFKTTDAGTTWTAINDGLRDSPDTVVVSLAIDPRTPSTLYAATADGNRVGVEHFAATYRVFKSIDSGGHWTATTLTLQRIERDFQPLPIEVNPEMPEIVYAGSGSSIFRTENGGVDWILEVNLAADHVLMLTDDPASPPAVYAATVGGMYKSTDGGTNWRKSGLLDLAVWATAIDLAAPAHVYAGTDNGVYETTDAGGTWVRVMTGLPNTSVYKLIEAISPATLYAASGSAVFKTTDGARSWQIVDLPLELAPPIRLAVDPLTSTTLYAGSEYVATDGGASVFKSIDGGGHWRRAGHDLDGAGIDSLRVNPSRPDEVYAATSRGTFITRDRGETWTAVTDSVIAERWIWGFLFDPTRPETVYASSFTGIYGTADAGVRWQQISALPPTALALLRGGQRALLVGTFESGVLRVPLPACSGDCSGDGRITVSELVTGTRVMLEETELSACPNLDANGDDHVTIDELVQAVDAALRTCPP